MAAGKAVVKKCSGGDPRDPNHCWHWTGKTITWRKQEQADGRLYDEIVDPAEERTCCNCGRVGLAHETSESSHGKFRTARRGEPANNAEWVA